MRWLGGKEERPGWVKAPSEIELEIRTVWQEDEMPEEIKADPGYQPFTLGSDAQAWVDSMIEIADGGSAVYGRPKSVATPARRQLSTPPPSLPAATRPRAPAPTVPQPLAGSRIHAPRLLMPEIDEAPRPSPVRTLPRRVLMPDIGSDNSPHPKPPIMPDIAEDELPQPKPRLMPDIAEEELPHPKPPVMPEIAEEEVPQPKPPLMPDIG